MWRVYRFVGEETYSKGAAKEYLVGREPTWVVDPLDGNPLLPSSLLSHHLRLTSKKCKGTVNFVHGFVMFCVSIGFLLDGVPIVGVIYAPFLNQLFSSRSGA